MILIYLFIAHKKLFVSKERNPVNRYKHTSLMAVDTDRLSLVSLQSSRNQSIWWHHLVVTFLMV